MEANACVNSIVWKVKNYINIAFTSKGLYTWWKDIFPEKYIVKINPTENKVYFWYLYEWVTGNFQVIDLNSEFFWSYGCDGVILSGQELDIIMYPGFQTDFWQKGFSILKNGSDSITGELYFYFNYPWYSKRDLAKMQVDERSKRIFYFLCDVWNYDSNNNYFKCIKRR